MTYIDYANRYWRVARANYASNNCGFLYFFLLDYVNGLHWEQPFKCPTALITETFKISKQQVINARQELVSLGLIRFQEGKSRHDPPMYYLTTGAERESFPGLEKLTVGKTVDKTDEKTVCKTVGETQYKDIDKDNKSHTQKGEDVSIDCLEGFLLSNEEWYCDFISKLNLDDKRGKDYVHSFVKTLRGRGITSKDTLDARSHCFNWVRTELSKRKPAKHEAPIGQKLTDNDPSRYTNMEVW